jgi:hypothetical protein
VPLVITDGGSSEGEKAVNEKNPALNVEAIRKSPTHEQQVRKRNQKLSPSRPPEASPTPTVAPIRHCVVDTGIDKKEASDTVKADANSMQNPREGVIIVNL